MRPRRCSTARRPGLALWLASMLCGMRNNAPPGSALALSLGLAFCAPSLGASAAAMQEPAARAALYADAPGPHCAATLCRCRYSALRETGCTSCSAVAGMLGALCDGSTTRPDTVCGIPRAPQMPAVSPRSSYGTRKDSRPKIARQAGRCLVSVIYHTVIHAAAFLSLFLVGGIPPPPAALGGRRRGKLCYNPSMLQRGHASPLALPAGLRQ